MIRKSSTVLALVLAAALVAAMAYAQGPRAGQPGAGFQAARTAAANQPAFAATVAGASHADLADLLGISSAELTAERLAGKTVADIVVEHGLTTADVSAKLASLRDARIDAAVDAGTLDAARATVMKSRTQAIIAALLTRDVGPWAGSAPAAAGARGVGSGMAARPMACAAWGGGGAYGAAPRAGLRSGRGFGPGAGIQRPGSGFQPGYRFGPPTN